MPDNRFFTNQGSFSIKQIADLTNSTIVPPTNVSGRAEDVLIYDLNTLEKASSKELSFFSNSKYLAVYEKTEALVCITSEQYKDKAPSHLWLLLNSNPYRAYAEVTTLFYPYKQEIEETVIAPSAIVSPKAKLGKNCSIGPNVVIEDGVEIGDRCSIGAGAVIGRGVVIGDNAIIGANATIVYSIIGKDALIYSGVCIGQDGFGFATDKGRHYKVMQLGRVVIGDDVEIGANTTIDRGAIDDTVIGNMCRIDNLVQIGHNVQIGNGCIIVAQVGIAGSTKIGNYCVVGGQAGFAGHLEIGDYCQIGGQAGVSKSLASKSIVSGSPAIPLRDWLKQHIILKNLLNK